MPSETSVMHSNRDHQNAGTLLGLPRMKGLLLCGGMLGVAGLVAWGSGFAVLLATQICVLWCFGLSYQLLFGRTGMLSFGHAVNFGLAAFATTHAVRWLGGPGGWPIYEILPLFGALAGMLCGLVLGYPVTRRSGVAFAMVTLGLGELVAACFLMFPGFFGGEAGITLQRTTVASALGLDYGRSANQLVLTSCWSLLVVGVILWLAQTPFGLAILAVRENPQRIEFLGYRTASVRWASYLVASTLAGIAGSLSALTYEIVTVDSVSLHTSANVLLMTVIGGAQSVLGPLVGAVFLTVMQSVVSDWTRAWLFYYGFVFVIVVLEAPDGIMGLFGRPRGERSTRSSMTRASGYGLFAVLLVVFVETCYQLTLGEPTQLPGWQDLKPPELKAILLCSGALVAAAIVLWLRSREVQQ